MMHCPLSHSSCAKKTVVTIVLIAVVAILAFVFLSKNGLFQKSAYDKSSKTFADWQPVKSKDFGYALRIPSTWSLTLKSDNGDYVRYQQGGTMAEITVKPAPSLKEFLSALDKERSTAYEGQTSVAVKNEKALTISGFSATQREVFLNAGGFPAIETFIFANGKVYLFATLFQGASGLSGAERGIHRDVLSTLTISQ